MMPSRRALCAALLLFVGLLAAPSARAAFLQPVGQFNDPIFVTSPPGNSDRLLVVQRSGLIMQVQDDSTSTFADLRSEVVVPKEGGLLSIALAPDFGSSGRLYAFYTGEEGEIHVAELRQVDSTAPLSTLRDLLTIPHPNHENHYGGQLQIGPEGLLYISTGDGGGAGDPEQNAQNLTRPLGKILRIDPNPGALLPYTVPASNPFAGGDPLDDVVWAFGLRNPFRFSFDRVAGDIWIGDVGQDAREEVNYAPAPGLGAGANYGWNCREGTIAGPGTDPECPTTPPDSFTDPVFDYVNPADPSEGCAVIGGYMVRDRSLGDLFGRYLYGDACTGELRSFSPSAPFATDRTEVLTVEGLTSFGEDSCGRLYAVSGNGGVSRLANPTPAACAATTNKAFAFVGIRAHSRKVRKGTRALITVWASPCAGRRGQPVKLWRGAGSVGTRRLDRACTARFRPRIRRKGNYRATINEDATYIGAISRKLKMRIRHRAPAKRDR